MKKNKFTQNKLNGKKRTENKIVHTIFFLQNVGLKSFNSQIVRLTRNKNWVLLQHGRSLSKF